MELEQLDVLRRRECGDPGVQLQDRGIPRRMAVVPGQHVRDRDVHARRESTSDHLVQVREDRGGRRALDDVVDASLDDERIGAGERVVEPRTVGSGSQYGLPAVIESPSAATIRSASSGMARLSRMRARGR